MKWLLLMHQIPPKPDAVRVKIWRSLQKSFALAVKNSVYALPSHERTRKIFGEIAREIEERGGEAVLCEASFIRGKSSEALKDEYNALLSASFTGLAKTLWALKTKAKKQKKGPDLMPLWHELSRATSLLNDLSERNFLNCEGERVCRALLKEISKVASTPAEGPHKPSAASINKREFYRGRTWVTRKGIAYDRIASAWLIKKYIDPDGKFLFVDLKTYKKYPDHITFDMHDGDFTHEGELCTFEVLVQKFKLKSPSLKEIAKIIHDLDIQDEKYEHPAASGVKSILDGIISSTSKDSDRLSLGSKCLDHLEASL